MENDTVQRDVDAPGRESMRPTKPSDPKPRMGLYKTLDDVPERYRLHRFADAYADEDTWQVFCEDVEYAAGSYARFEEEVDRVGDHWKAHMVERDRHHALATPADVEAWCASLLNGRSLRRSHDYFLRVRRFYDWLYWHSERDHRHHPVLMAASECASAGRIWAYKTEQTRESRRDYQRQTNE